MPTYFIGYDLSGDSVEPDYDLLTEELERLGAQRILLSEWCLDIYDTNCTALRDHLKMFIKKHDRLLVVKDEDWSGHNLISNPND